VKIFQHAVRTGNGGIILQMVIAAVCIAPVAEEILFRGYIYPVFKRTIGTVPAALGSALLFAAIHGNALGFPGLTLLALALTLAYEFTGSLAVPVFMHAWFNGLSLLGMWLAVRYGFVT
jgi:membrane protease YdiL (CAAX protease family)